MEELRGYFAVRPLASHQVLIEYGTAVDVSRWVPDSLQRRAMRTDIPEALGHLRRFVEQGGRCGN